MCHLPLTGQSRISRTAVNTFDISFHNGMAAKGEKPKMKPHKKSLLIVTIVAAAVAVALFMPKVADAEINSLGPRGLKQDAAGVLEAAKTGDPRVDNAIDSVIRSIDMSLRGAYWVDDTRLNSKRGRPVLDYEHRAAGTMAFLTKFWLRRDSTSDQQQAIDAFKQVLPKLVEADKLLAETALEDAHNTSPPTKPKKQKSYNRSLKEADQAYKRALIFGRFRPALHLGFTNRQDTIREVAMWTVAKSEFLSLCSI